MQIQDSLAIAAVVAELRRDWIGARLDKIHFPTPHTLVMALRAEGRSGRLLVAARGNFSRIHLTQARFENPAHPPMFCMLLRKHLEGTRILRIEQFDLERAVQIVTAGRDELGDPTERALVVEITGKHANMILLDRPGGSVLGCLRLVGHETSRERQILPGLPYDPPPVSPSKRDPRTLDEEGLWAIAAEGGALDAALLKGVHSLSRVAIAQILSRANLPPTAQADMLDDASLHRLMETWRAVFREVAAGEFQPRRTPGCAWDFNVLKDPAGGPSLGANELFDAYYTELEQAERMAGLRGSLDTLVKERLNKLSQREEALQEAVRTSEEAERLRIWGELIQAYGYGLADGATLLVAPDHYQDGSPEVHIPLEPRLTPMENAQRYFRRYQKARAGREMSEKLWEEARADLDYWRGVAQAIALCERPEELLEIKAELNPEPPSRKAKPSEPTAPLKFRTPDGIEILVGKNNRQNDDLTMRLARPEEWWFHAQQIPGSHVIVRHAGELPPATRDAAALLAAYFSQARDSGNVPVIYTQRRHLKKPAGAKPGLVLYERERSLYVTPTPELIEALERLPANR